MNNSRRFMKVIFLKKKSVPGAAKLFACAFYECRIKKVPSAVKAAYFPYEPIFYNASFRLILATLACVFLLDLS